MRLRKYLEEQTVSGDVAGYDTPASTKTFKRKIEDEYNVPITIKNPDDFETIKRIAKQNNVDVIYPRKSIENGDIVRLIGTKENVDKTVSELSDMGAI